MDSEPSRAAQMDNQVKGETKECDNDSPAAEEDKRENNATALDCDRIEGSAKLLGPPPVSSKKGKQNAAIPGLADGCLRLMAPRIDGSRRGILLVDAALDSGTASHHDVGTGHGNRMPTALKLSRDKQVPSNGVGP